ncbi:hypothetical protein ICE98_01470 [Lactococcus lactis]|nr:hypothetical protein [Lactococcus lactis]
MSIYLYNEKVKLKKQIDPNIEEAEIVIIARTEEEFSQVVKQYHLQDLTANEEDKLYLATNKGFEIVNIREILYLKSEKNYLEFYTVGGVIRVRSPLYFYEKKLAKDFIKISRNTLINFEQITRLETDFVYGWYFGFLRINCLSVVDTWQISTRS